MASQDMNISASRNEGFQGSGVLRHKRDRRWGVSVGAICPGVHAHRIGSTDNEAHQKCNCQRGYQKKNENL